MHWDLNPNEALLMEVLSSDSVSLACLLCCKERVTGGTLWRLSRTWSIIYMLVTFHSDKASHRSSVKGQGSISAHGCRELSSHTLCWLCGQLVGACSSQSRQEQAQPSKITSQWPTSSSSQSFYILPKETMNLWAFPIIILKPTVNSY